jgi:hypothetical protein
LKRFLSFAYAGPIFWTGCSGAGIILISKFAVGLSYPFFNKAEIIEFLSFN